MKFLFLILLLLFSTKSLAIDCTPSNLKTENIAQYLETIAQSLVGIKIYLSKFDSLTQKKSFDPADLMVGFKELKESYECSASMISAYKTSKVEGINESAKSLSVAYQILASDVGETIETFKSDIDGKNTNSPSAEAEIQADKRIKVKKTWEHAIMAISAATFSAVGKENPKTKKMDTLVITKTERDNIVRLLKSQFLLPGKKGDKIPLDMAAKVYFEFFEQPWKYN